jgi:hypothetical protein
MASDTEKMLRQKLEELTAQRASILSVTTPLREQRDKILNDARASAAVLADQIREAEKDLPSVDTDIGRLSRALGGRAMSQPAPQVDAPPSENPQG